MAKPKRGYIVLVKGLDEGHEWEAAYTGVFTSRRAAERERAYLRKENRARDQYTYAIAQFALPEEATNGE